MKTWLPAVLAGMPRGRGVTTMGRFAATRRLGAGRGVMTIHRREPAVNAPTASTLPADPPPAKGWDVRIGAVLAVYWIAMLVGTHLPAQAPKTNQLVSDKPIHFVAFFGLTLLLVAWRRARRGTLGVGTIAAAVVVVLVYGAFDELTQPLFGRVCDLADWLSDTGGAGAAALLAWALTRRDRRKSPPPLGEG
ncbi:VanZ like family protein [Pseudobythopirellula maris]|uniref:VanZ like family protein n=1 Tax=Pseudobythopirellula maris TaxID=2527991 RepID=A0A5C5ZL59_9BACT|nr:VanZ family protein [Pseudobythopirellula maris]TWT88174.1 VanZ like family protein [Pseudobythopirellula maris]